jgi:spore germination protein GerM
MPRSRTRNNFPLGWIVGIGITLFAVGGATAWFAIQKLSSQKSITPSPVESPTIEPTPVSSPTIATPQPSPVAIEPTWETRAVYWLKVTDTGSELAPREIEIQKSTPPDQEIAGLFQVLLAGPGDPSDTSTIPAGTKLLSLNQDKTGIKVNLSKEFGIDDGSDVLIGRLAQVLYTATSLDPSARVWIQVEGKPLELLGEGQGLEVAQPMTRKFFEENYQLSGH